MSGSADNAVLLEMLKEIRSEMRNYRALLLESLDQGRTLERQVDTQLLAVHQRISELREELEQTIKSELMGLVGDIQIGRSHEG
jgi:hypothetical protein